MNDLKFLICIAMKRITFVGFFLVIALTLLVSQSLAFNWVHAHTWYHIDSRKVENYIDADSIKLDESSGLIYIWIRTKEVGSDFIDYLCFRYKTNEFTTLQHGELDFFGNVKESSHGPADGKTQQILHGTSTEYCLQKALALKGIKYEMR